MSRRHYFSIALKSFCLGLVILMTTSIAHANPNPNPNPLMCDSISTGLNRLLTHVNPAVHVGVVVQSMQTGHIYYTYHANHFLAPASVQKIFTVVSALINLKPTYRFPTRLLTDGSIQNGVLNGDLIFQFNGDPSLTADNLLAFVEKLKSIGVDRISGNIIVDDTAFGHIPYPPGWLWHDLSFDFAAPLNTVIIDRNQFGMSFVPAYRSGKHATLIPHLPPESANIINQTITTQYPRFNCPVKIYSNENNQYLIRGCLAKNQGTQYRSLAIRNLQMFTKDLIFQLLRQKHIGFYPHVYYAKTPMNARIIAEHFSAPLSQLIIHLLKVSDNLYADALLKKLGEHMSHTPGTWVNGLAAMRLILANDIGVDLQGINFHDGSGLSLYNFVTPDSISRVLYFIDHNPMLKRVMIPALPIAGVDGTLAWRMPNMAKDERLHAKTGSMTGVDTLAGFIKTHHHGVLSFVVMFNKIPQNRGPYMYLEDRICEFLMQAEHCQ